MINIKSQTITITAVAEQMHHYPLDKDYKHSKMQYQRWSEKVKKVSWARNEFDHAKNTGRQHD